MFDVDGEVLHFNQSCKAKLKEAGCDGGSARVVFSKEHVSPTVDDLGMGPEHLNNATLGLMCGNICLDLGTGWELSKVESDGEQYFIAIGAYQGSFVLSADQNVHELDTEKESLHSTYEKLAEKIPGFVFQFKRDENGAFSFPFISSGFSKIFEENLKGLKYDAGPVLALVHRDDRMGFDDSIHKSAKHLSFWKHTFRFVCSKDSFKWVQGIGVPEKVGDAIVWRGFMYDVSDKMNFEQKLRKQQAELEEIAFLQAHEFRRPVANMLSLSDMIEVHCRGLDTMDSLVELLNMLKKSVREADEVIAKIVTKTNNSKWLVSGKSV